MHSAIYLCCTYMSAVYLCCTFMSAVYLCCTFMSAVYLCYTFTSTYVHEMCTLRTTQYMPTYILTEYVCMYNSKVYLMLFHSGLNNL